MLVIVVGDLPFVSMYVHRDHLQASNIPSKLIARVHVKESFNERNLEGEKQRRNRSFHGLAKEKRASLPVMSQSREEKKRVD